MSKRRVIIAAAILAAIAALLFGLGGTSASAGGYSGASTIALSQINELAQQSKLAQKICNTESLTKQKRITAKFDLQRQRLDEELTGLGYFFSAPDLMDYTMSLKASGKCKY